MELRQDQEIRNQQYLTGNHHGSENQVEEEIFSEEFEAGESERGKCRRDQRAAGRDAAG
ncbi:MAG: hypothetical protein ABI579_06965 [Candidatus Sumerlaeota bacterium]